MKRRRTQMANRTTRALFVMAVLAIPSAATAQRWGRGPFPGSGACFFRNADFGGEYFCVPAGENVGRVPDDMNDEISSIRVFGRASVIVFRDIRFGGDSVRFDHSVRNLREEHWNDRISSMRVDLGAREGDFRDRRDGDFRDRRDGDFRDRRDDDRRDRRGEGETARAREIVRRAYLSVFKREPEPGAEGWVNNVIQFNWTQDDLERELRKSPEYRDKFTLTRPKAQEIVRRAYLNVFKREPDPGAAGWVDNVLRNNWTQDDLERELKKSPEYQQKNR
jgi:uncharacterized protein YnzC (UPF0291/DUF896 family)